MTGDTSPRSSPRPPADRPVAGVLLAAGSGSRLGRPKALVSLGGELLVERGRRLLADGGCTPVVVVLGAAAAQVRRRAALPGAQVVLNPGWASGMGSSLRVALAHLGPGDAAAAVVALADQPLVGAAAVHRLVAAWQGGAVVAVATYDGAARNPVLFDRSTWAGVSAAAVGDSGARGWLRAHPELVTPVDCDGTGAPDDVDTAADLAAVTAGLEE